jgi:histidine triad (HIT) family protein
MEDCLFCKIVKSEIPSYKIYEDDDFYAFLDIFPRTKGHTLLIPKKHYRWTHDVPNFGEYWETAKKITKALQEGLSPEFVTYVTYGMDVMHAHIHILPRDKEDTQFMPPAKKFTDEEMKQIVEDVKSHFTSP